MNLFMASFIAVTNYRDTHIPNKVIRAAADILEQDGFQCDEKLIPTSTYELPVLDAAFYTTNELSEIFFGKQLPFKTDKDSLIATNGEETLTVTENYFVYNTGKKENKSATEKKLRQVLEKTGFDMDGAVYDEKEACFYRMYKGTNLFNMYIKAKIDQNGELCHISALWPTEITSHEKVKLSFVASVTKVKEIFPNGGKISLIEKGYSLTALGNNNYRFIPSWRVKVGKELQIIE